MAGYWSGIYSSLGGRSRIGKPQIDNESLARLAMKQVIFVYAWTSEGGGAVGTHKLSGWLALYPVAPFQKCLKQQCVAREVQQDSRPLRLILCINKSQSR
jgi:hypothetical protein